MKKQIVLLMCLSFFMINVNAQPWINNLSKSDRYSGQANFYEVQKAFNDYWKDKKYERSNGIKPFRRWENFMEPRVYPSGKLPAASLWKEFIKRESGKVSGTKTSGNWTHMGPYQVPTGINDNVLQGAGRLNCVEFHPTNPDIMWVGAPGGGFWKTVDGGNNWYTTTDDLPVIGVSDIAVHPTNSDIIFMATGDLDGRDTYSIGLMKSTDGGETWNTTGLSYTALDGNQIRGILINPENPDIMLVGSYFGIFKSTDGGENWDSVISIEQAGFVNLMYKPGDYSTIYASTISYQAGGIYKSTDGGDTFEKIIDNLPQTDFIRTEVAVTPANPEVVYCIFTNSATALRGVYKSTDSGETWTETVSSSSINLLGWAADGSDSGGQASYDLSIAVSPVDENEVWVGGVNIWKSLDGGVNWNLQSHWNPGTVGVGYVHADHHEFRYSPEGVLFSVNDGGINKTIDGENWINIGHGLNILQIYRLGTSATNENLAVTGAQDNGTYLCDNGEWFAINGGDGMECIIDYADENIMYGTSQFGNIQKSTDRGLSFTNISPTSNGAWITPYMLHPTDHNTIYAAYKHVYKSTDGGENWQTLSASLNGDNIRTLAIAPSNTDYIYAGIYGQGYSDLYFTSNEGEDWTEISTNLPDLAISYITISDNDPQKIWVTLSGYEEGEKVYMTTDAGANWTNYSEGLPNLPTNCIIYQNETDDFLYVGTDLGIYYRDNSMDTWTEFNEGLPNVMVYELEIHYATQRLRAATYGRGLWESHLYDDGTNAPVASFSADKEIACGEETVVFSDHSAYSPTSWEWTFSPNTVTFVNGTDANSQNPEVQFNAADTYSVSLTVTNSNGNNSITKNDFIIQAPIITDFRANRTLTYPEGKVYFEDQTICEATSWEWTFTPETLTFHDGTNANSQNPVVSFDNAGDYTVSLLATNSLGSETETKTDYISVGNNYFMEDAEITTCVGYFYDSNGPDGNYADGENYVITFYPDVAENMLQFDFTEFSVEWHSSCGYDFLEIYNGTSTSDELIGQYCGTDSPEIVTANNPSGALTFKFHSDGGVTDLGWTASIDCVIVGVQENNTELSGIDIFPNPNNHIFNVKVNGFKDEDLVIKIYNVEGKLVFSENYSDVNKDFTTEINLKGNAKGVYFIEVISSNKVMKDKVIIE